MISRGKFSNKLGIPGVVPYKELELIVNKRQIWQGFFFLASEDVQSSLSLIILLSVCSLSVSYAPSYYRMKSHEDGPKMLAINFKLSWGLR